MIKKHFNIDNPHHAYLIESAWEDVMPDIANFLGALGIATSRNPDFYEVRVDNFKIEDALEIRSRAQERGITSGKKVFVVTANHFSREAEQALLKMFEEPIPDTLFFLVVPDINALLKTLVSRFYAIRHSGNAQTLKEAEKFIALSARERIDFLKDLLSEKETDGEETTQDSSRSKALRFLNDLENALHGKFIKSPAVFKQCMNQVLLARKYLRQPGSSAKNLMESVALLIPEKT